MALLLTKMSCERLLKRHSSVFFDSVVDWAVSNGKKGHGTCWGHWFILVCSQGFSTSSAACNVGRQNMSITLETDALHTSVENISKLIHFWTCERVISCCCRDNVWNICLFISVLFYDEAVLEITALAESRSFSFQMRNLFSSQLTVFMAVHYLLYVSDVDPRMSAD